MLKVILLTIGAALLVLIVLGFIFLPMDQKSDLSGALFDGFIGAGGLSLHYVFKRKKKTGQRANS